MIQLTFPKDCCGCSACAQRCPQQCIKMQEDKEGFLYPSINTDLCTNCRLCEKVCPSIVQANEHLPLKVYAAKNTNEKKRLQSSSGGVFTSLAEIIIKEKGVIFGACFDENWEVSHSYTDTLEGIEPYRRSKYVQSNIRNSYQQVEAFLKQGRKVLFTGSPCQVAGLKLFLRKEYSNLLSVDFVCHGVPSRKVWRIYLNEVIQKLSLDSHTPLSKSTIASINFRNKKDGWKKYCFQLTMQPDRYHHQSELCEPYYENTFMKGFLHDLILRPSCYQCPSKKGKSGSDLTIADYWNIQQVLPQFDDDKGVGLVLINTNKGAEYYSFIQEIISVGTTYEEAKGNNGGFNETIVYHKNREKFFNRLDKKKNISFWIEEMIKTTNPTLKEQIQSFIKEIFSK